MYITWNNVASVWECQKWRLKTNLFWETSKISMFFSPVSHCRTLYSKSLIQGTRPNLALWALAARQLWSDGFRRLINGFRRDLNGVWSGWFSDETFKNVLITRWFHFANLRSKSLTECNFGLHRETCSPEANHIQFCIFLMYIFGRWIYRILHGRDSPWQPVRKFILFSGAAGGARRASMAV